MSLGLVIKAPEGLVLAAESRITLTAQEPGQPPIHVNFDNVTKLFDFGNQGRGIGVVTYGQAAIGLRTAHSFTPEFEDLLGKERLNVLEFSKKLSDFFMIQWKGAMPPDYNGPAMTFLVAGFNEGDPYGSVYQVDIPSHPEPIPQNVGSDKFGITWGGQREFVDRLIQGFDSRLMEMIIKNINLAPEQIQKLNDALLRMSMQIPLLAMPLQDCIDLAVFFIRTTIDAQNLTVGIRGCGGFIDVATITRRDGLDYIQRKVIRGESTPKSNKMKG